MGRRRSVEAERFWRRMIRGQAGSGLSVRAYCDRHGIAEPTFYVWRKRLRQQETPPASAEADRSTGSTAAMQFVPVDVVAPPAEAQLEIEADSGVVIRVREAASVETLQRVLCAAAGYRQPTAGGESREDGPC